MKFDLGERISRGLVDNTLSSCSRWAEHRIHMPNPFPGLLKFDRFPWQKEIIDIDEGIVTVKKAAQIGFSIAGLIRSLYVVSELARDVLYVLPTQGLAGDFSKGRLDALVELSPELDDIFKKGNSVGLKVTNKRSNIYIRGSVSSRGLVSVPVSSAIIDEYDRCADNTYELVTERLSGQEIKYLFSLSTPTLPEFGIDKQFRNGTQELFHFKCPSCRKLETLRWPDNVIIRGEHHNDTDCDLSYYYCTHCRATLPHESKVEWLKGAVWVPQVKIQGHRSFHINQMFSTTVTPGEIAQAHFKAQLSDLAAIEFKNQKLGEPHVVKGAQLTDKLLSEAKGDHQSGSNPPENAMRQICMGVDVGTFLDVAIVEYLYDGDPGREPYEKSRAKLLHTLRIPQDEWRELHNVMRTWQVQHACVDFQPDTVNARRFCRKFKGFASMVQYRRGTIGNEIKETKDEQDVPCLTVDRTVFLDMVLRRFHKKRVSIPYDVRSVYLEHMKSPIRTYELDELGLPRGVYKSIADDHFAHAMAYAEIAHFRAYVCSTGRTIKPGEEF